MSRVAGSGARRRALTGARGTGAFDFSRYAAQRSSLSSAPEAISRVGDDGHDHDPDNPSIACMSWLHLLNAKGAWTMEPFLEAHHRRREQHMNQPEPEHHHNKDPVDLFPHVCTLAGGSVSRHLSRWLRLGPRYAASRSIQGGEERMRRQGTSPRLACAVRALRQIKCIPAAFSATSVSVTGRCARESEHDTCAGLRSSSLVPNDLYRRGRIGPVSLTIHDPDGERLDSGSHVGRNTQVDIVRPRRAAACRALGKSERTGRRFRRPSKDAQIGLDAIAVIGGGVCVGHRRDASEPVVRAGGKRSAPRRYAELTRRGAGSCRRRRGNRSRWP